MKITKAKLKQIIQEELESPDDIIASHPDPEGKNPDQVIYRWQQDEFDHREKVLKSIQALDYLEMKAKDYHNDPTLSPGDIKALLQDDFLDSHYPKFFGIDEGEPSVAEYIEQYAAGEGLNEGKKMKITKEQLKQIIKEELENVVEAPQSEGGPEVDIQNAIQMLESEEDTTGTLSYVIKALYEALDKLGVGGGSWRYTGQGEPMLEQATGESAK
jgi:hypothetical protein